MGQVDNAAARALAEGDLAAPDLRDEAVSRAASVVSAIPEVRAALVDYQRAFGESPPGAVIDGRDIGTVVFPDATHKLFVTADPEIRAARRYAELAGRGAPSDRAEVLRELAERDARDRGRAVAPLTPAADAVVLDTSALDIDEAFEAALDAISGRAAPAPGDTRR